MPDSNLLTCTTVVKKAASLNSTYPKKTDQTEDLILKGKIIHAWLHKSHEQLYSKILSSHISSINSIHEKEIEKLNYLIESIDNEQKIKTKMDKLSKKLIEATILEQIKNLFSQKNFKKIAAILRIVKQKEERNIRGNTRIKEINVSAVNDSTNFAIAAIVFVVTTKNRETAEIKKHLYKSFPVKAENLSLYNYQQINMKHEGSLFKKFFKETYEFSDTILKYENIKLNGEGSNVEIDCCNEKYYPQIAFHSEKFFFYYLLEKGGLEAIIELLPKKSIEPNNVASIMNVEIRMHSSRSICRTCEPVSIGAIYGLRLKLNELLTNKGYPSLCDNPIKFVITSNTNNKDRGYADATIKTIDLSRLTVADYSIEQKTILKQYHSRTHDYTFFGSGGESQARKAEKEGNIHGEALKCVINEDQNYWANKEKISSIKIQHVFRKYMLHNQ